MSLLAPKDRKHRMHSLAWFEALSPRSRIRSDDADISLTNALMSGFAMFSLKCPSLLDFDKQRADGNMKTIYGIDGAPCDSYMREMLDPVSPESLRPAFKGVFRQLQRGKAAGRASGGPCRPRAGDRAATTSERFR